MARETREAEISPVMRAYVLLRIIPLPLAVPTFAIGLSSDSRAAIVAGFVLLGVWLVDTAIVMPFVLARKSRTRRHGDSADRAA